ncbi:MAG: nuclear transport factor 2 family protein [Verrucomicrobia bacterium]|nr:nuclear transport factor 2 family protein [Verrucomicrobiota bacterium]
MRSVILLTITAMLGFAAPVLAADTEKETIHKRVDAFVDALNKENPQALSSLLTDTVTCINPLTGKVVHGKTDVVKFFEMEFPQLKGKKLLFIETSMAFPSVGKAIVDGASELTEKDVILKRQARRLELVKLNDTWYINAIKEVDVQLPPNMYSHLKELSWLVGDWRDRDEHVQITYSTKWDRFRNFLLQHYKIDTYGVEVMEGQQIIGWDPLENTIRSWVYDSDGGYGTGTWSQKDGSWFVKLHFVLSTGQKCSATNIYTKRDDKSYIYSSVDREVNGKKLPNIQPVTVVKEG